MMRVMLAVVLTVLALTGCATTANYEKILQSWVGLPADNLVRSWGPPASAYKLSDGGQVLQYSNQQTVMLGGDTHQVPQTSYTNGTVMGSGGGFANYSGTTTTYTTQTTPAVPVTMTCTTRFNVNANGVITSWTWQGNNCKARAPS